MLKRLRRGITLGGLISLFLKFTELGEVVMVVDKLLI